MKMKNSESLAGIFTKSPEVIADTLSSREFFSTGAAGGLRILSAYIAYAGRRLSVNQRHSLERAREILAGRARETLKERRPIY